ncbi:hypothetical protein QOZ80_5AG0372010 [Eleusine coracana subsp. coracana]|nr:hypothetical protein QOZ80_5AG0372010 [Eleusine coracana subsp. coracana]
MEAAVIVFSIVARLLSVASVVLGFIADAKKLTPNDIYYSQGKCVYPSNPAFGLGIVALSLLVAAQIIVSLVGSCLGNGGATGSRRVWGIVCYALSWVAAVIAVALYVQGVVWSAATTRSPEASTMLFMRCRFLIGDVFTRAALMSLAATALGAISYTLLRAQAPAAPPAAGPSRQKPDFPPTGEAVVVPMEGYAQAWNPQSSRPPQRQAQPAYEVMIA